MEEDIATDDLVLAHRLADAADRITRAAFVPGGSVEHRIKSDGTPVSATDQEVEEALLDLVRGLRPGDAFLGEEVGAHGSGDRRWIVDGVDGTSNFVVGGPLWGTLVALLVDGVPVLGMHSSPAQERRSWASAGGGAWTAPNDGHGPHPATQLSVARPPRGGHLRANVELAWETHPMRPVVDRLVEAAELVEMTTHPALMVAGGQLDFAVQLGGGPWDVAAFMIIVREAGGRCLTLEGAEITAPEPPMIHTGGLEKETLRRLLGA